MKKIIAAVVGVLLLLQIVLLLPSPGVIDVDMNYVVIPPAGEILETGQMHVGGRENRYMLFENTVKMELLFKNDTGEQPRLLIQEPITDEDQQFHSLHPGFHEYYYYASLPDGSDYGESGTFLMDYTRQHVLVFLADGNYIVASSSLEKTPEEILSVFAFVLQDRHLPYSSILDGAA